MPSPDTRTRILATASSHFARHGFEGASLRRIGEEAGITAASIFHHFPGGKVELYEAMISDIVETVTHRIIGRYAESAGLPPVEAILRMLALFWEHFEEHPEHATVILLRATGMDREVAARTADDRSSMIDTARRLFTTAQERGELADFDIDEFLLWCSSYTLAVHGAPYLPRFLCRDESRARLLQGYLAMVRARIEP